MDEKKDTKIGIVGIGSVGSPLKNTCEHYFKNVTGYDKKGNYEWEKILDCDIVFVCVPTPLGIEERLDCSCVDEVLTRLDNNSYSGIVAIKSTLKIGFMNKATMLHPKLHLVYCPEFLREKSAFQWTVNPDRIVVSGDPEDTKKVLSTFCWAENAERIITDHLSAEIGKLAHNALIATKVSFTNEIERICIAHGANPEEVMDIVTSDRRVKSKEHLTPYLGPYGGKCVPKDTKELKTVSNSDFLQVVENVNEKTKLRYQRYQDTEGYTRKPKVNFKTVVIIPTRSRLQRLKKALISVANQTRIPDELIIIGEKETDFPRVKKIDDQLNKTKIHWLLNKRTKNLSGAVNTAVQFLINEGKDPTITYLAFHDDDDTWEPEHLQLNYEFVTSKNMDLGFSGIIRHKKNDPKSYKLEIPSQLTQDMFFVGNPHIQGSNLFIRMSTFLKAGCFDENLPSTTDRDFMIRVLDLGDTKYTYIPKYTIHHNTDAPIRLSTYGSTLKKRGLTQFLQKYGSRMTDKEMLHFKHRAANLFGWIEKPQKEKQTSITTVTVPCGKEHHTFHLVIGFTASNISCTNNILCDLKVFQKSFSQPISLVILDNTGNPQQLEQLIYANHSIFSTVKIISKNEIDRDSEANKLGAFYIDPQRRKGPSFGRTALHRFLYLIGSEIEKPVFWILDDDIRLDEIAYSTEKKLTPVQFKRFIDFLLENRVAICGGGIIGDPPLPIASSIRVQLLELNCILQKLQTNQTIIEKSDEIYLKSPDQHYDLSISQYDHLETPLNVIDQKTTPLSDLILSIFEGKNRLRPALPHNAEIKMRGGNTIVTDIECLRTFPNSSPRINGIELRRGDTIWLELNRYLGGEIGGKENKLVKFFPFFLRQDRAAKFLPKLLGDSLVADIQGGAFIRAFSALLNQKSKNSNNLVDIQNILKFSEDECKNVILETKQNIELRLDIVFMNTYRINGLASSIHHQIQNNSTNKTTLDSQALSNLKTLLDWITEEMSISRVIEFSQRLKIGVTEGITEFLLEFEKNRIQYATNLGLEATHET